MKSAKGNQTIEPLQSVDTTTLQVRVYNALRTKVIEGHFPPGTSFTIRSVAEAMGTSVMPVREALGRLLAEGALEMNLPSRQLNIPVMSRESVKELYDIRLSLEGMAAARAATRISADELRAVRSSLKAIYAATKARDQTAFLVANRAFHFGVYKASGSYHLMPIIESLWLKFGPLLRIPVVPQSPVETRLMEGSEEHHEAVVVALSEGNAKQARRGIENDLIASRAWFEQNYEPEQYNLSPNQRKQA